MDGISSFDVGFHRLRAQKDKQMKYRNNPFLVQAWCAVGALAECLLLPGCGGTGAQDGTSTVDSAAAPTGSGAEEASLAVEVLNEFATEDYSFSFELVGKNEERGDPGAIRITDTFSRYDRLAPLQQEQGLLTSLETFLAFAPDGQSPHPALIAAHEAEALAFGRIDTSTVKHLDGRNIAINKDRGISDCGENLYPPIGPLNYTSLENASVSIPTTQIYLCTGSPKKVGVGTPVGCQGIVSTKYQVAIACSTSRSPQPATVFFYQNQIPSFNPSLIAANEFVRVQIQPTPTPTRQGVSLAVQIKNGSNTSNLTRLLTGVGQL